MRHKSNFYDPFSALPLRKTFHLHPNSLGPWGDKNNGFGTNLYAILVLFLLQK